MKSSYLAVYLAYKSKPAARCYLNETEHAEHPVERCYQYSILNSTLNNGIAWITLIKVIMDSGVLKLAHSQQLF